MHPQLQKRLDQLTGTHRAYRSTFGNSEGQRVLKHICAACFVFKPSMNTKEKGLTEFNEGRRSVALEILAAIGKSEDDIMQLTQDSQKEGYYDE